MSDLDGARTPPKTSIPNFDAGKLPSARRSSVVLGGSEDVVDAFAEIFARMAADASTRPQAHKRSPQSSSIPRSLEGPVEPLRTEAKDFDSKPHRDSHDASSNADKIEVEGETQPVPLAGETDQPEEISSDDTPQKKDAETTGHEPQISAVVATQMPEQSPETLATSEKQVVTESQSAEVFAEDGSDQGQRRERASTADPEITSENPSAVGIKGGPTEESASRDANMDATDSTTELMDESTHELRRETQSSSHRRSDAQTADVNLASGARQHFSTQADQGKPGPPPAPQNADIAARADAELTAAQSSAATPDAAAAAFRDSDAVASIKGVSAAPSTPITATNSSAGRIATNPAAAITAAKTKSTTQSSVKSDSAETVSRVRLIQRVAKAFQHLGGNGGVVRLRLAPAELGSIQIEMKIQQRSVQGRVVAETEAAAAALREHLPDLRTRLESYGMQIEKLDVELGNNARQQGAPFEERSHQQTGQQQRSSGSPTRTQEATLESTDVSPEVSLRNEPDQGMDVRL